MLEFGLYFKRLHIVLVDRQAMSVRKMKESGLSEDLDLSLWVAKLITTIILQVYEYRFSLHKKLIFNAHTQHTHVLA